MSIGSRVISEAKSVIQPLVIGVAKFWFFTIDVAKKKAELRSYKTGIVETIDCQHSPSSKYAIFVYYEPGEKVSGSVERAITSLRSFDVNIILVCNHGLSNRQELFFRKNCHSILLRNNQGFDFGAYKDAVSFLCEKNIDVERLVIMNDSLFFSSHGLSSMFERMLGDEDVISTFENWGEEHHLQSFAISVSKKIFESSGFRKFWKSYIPINNRIYAIEKGEKKLSSAILRESDTSYVIFSVSSLYQKIVESDMAFPKGARWVPFPWRGMTEDWGEPDMNEYYAVKLAEVVNSTSPIHAGAYLFPKLLDCPIFKKDLVYRHRFNYWEIESWSTEFLDCYERDEYLDFLRKKGDATDLGLMDKIKFSIGAK